MKENFTRFAHLRKELGFTQTAFGEFLGLKGSTADIERGKTKIPGFVVAKLYQEYHVNPLWLFGSSGDMYIANIRDKASVLPAVVTLNSQENENVLLVSQKAAAGYPQNIADTSWYQTLPAFDLPLKEFRNATYRGFQVDGDSMLPALQPGDWVIAKALSSIDEVRPSKMYVVVLDDSVLVKKVVLPERSNDVILESLNSAYPAYKVKPFRIKEIWEVSSRLTFHLDADNNQQLMTELKQSMELLKRRLDTNN